MRYPNAIASASPSDEEKGASSARAPADDDEDEKKRLPTSKEEAQRETEEALEKQPAMTDVFSWQHLRYTVPIGHGETRQLLDDVSGYVAPGKLTALMGESGAGKVRFA